MFKPINIEKIIRNCTEADEHIWTLKYMCTYGVDKVRGSYYQDILMHPLIRNNLVKDLDGVETLCGMCNSLMINKHVSFKESDYINDDEDKYDREYDY
jgi:hypothetical protein